MLLICIKEHLKFNSWKSSAILRLSWKKALPFKKARVPQSNLVFYDHLIKSGFSAEIIMVNQEFFFEKFSGNPVKGVD